MAAVATALLALSTVPAGEPTQNLRRTLEDGRKVRFTFNPAERNGMLTVTAPTGETVRFTLQRAARGGFVFTDAAVSARDAPGMRLPRADLASVIDAVAYQ